MVYAAWAARQPFLLDTTGWHRCTPACKMSHISAWACPGGGGHAIATPACAAHPGCTPVLVNDMYVCSTGRRHVCDGTECDVQQGACAITGAAVQQAVVQGGREDSKAKSRRKRASVYTNQQIACAFIYDLLFSRRRVRYEQHRHRNCMELSRRLCMRYIRDSCKAGRPVMVQELVHIFYGNRDRLRSMAYLRDAATMASKQAHCRRYAGMVVRFWQLMSKRLDAQSYSFETVTCALLYMMRRGIAYDELMVIPHDPWLSAALPDAHAIRDAGVQRRQFTQVKNSINVALQRLVDSNEVSAVQIAECFQNVPDT